MATRRVAIKDGNLYYCLEHGQFFRDRNSIKEHTESHSHAKDRKRVKNMDEIRCPRCLNVFRSNSIMTMHREKMHDQHTFPFTRIDEVVKDEGAYIERIGILEVE